MASVPSELGLPVFLAMREGYTGELPLAIPVEKNFGISFGNRSITILNTMNNTLDAKQIKQIRAALGLTGDALAEMLGVTGNTVRRWECGARQAKGPAVAMLRRMYADITKNGRRKELANA